MQADENGKFDLTMNYATIPETGWTQRDWEGMTYTYQIEEVDTAFDGVTYGARLNITPYWVTLDGTTVRGETRTLTYNWYGITE